MMPRRGSVYYGSYQTQRKRDSKKRFIIILALLISIGLIVWLTLFLGTMGRQDFGDMTKDLVSEITELKLQIEEKNDEIAALNQKILEYEAELAIRPTIAPTPVPPPNETVMAGQPTPTPSPSPRRPRPQTTPSAEAVTPQAEIPVQPVEQVPVEESAPQQVPTESAENIITG